MELASKQSHHVADPRGFGVECRRTNCEQLSQNVMAVRLSKGVHRCVHPRNDRLGWQRRPPRLLRQHREQAQLKILRGNLESTRNTPPLLRIRETIMRP